MFKKQDQLFLNFNYEDALSLKFKYKDGRNGDKEYNVHPNMLPLSRKCKIIQMNIFNDKSATYVLEVQDTLNSGYFTKIIEVPYPMFIRSISTIYKQYGRKSSTN